MQTSIKIFLEKTLLLKTVVIKPKMFIIFSLNVHVMMLKDIHGYVSACNFKRISNMGMYQLVTLNVIIWWSCDFIDDIGSFYNLFTIIIWISLLLSKTVVYCFSYFLIFPPFFQLFFSSLLNIPLFAAIGGCTDIRR